MLALRLTPAISLTRPCTYKQLVLGAPASVGADVDLALCGSANATPTQIAAAFGDAVARLEKLWCVAAATVVMMRNALVWHMDVQ